MAEEDNELDISDDDWTDNEASDTSPHFIDFKKDDECLITGWNRPAFSL
jgi:hypothetical protein